MEGVPPSRLCHFFVKIYGALCQLSECPLTLCWPVTFGLKLIVDPWPVIFVILFHGTPRVEGVPPTRLCHFFVKIHVALCQLSECPLTLCWPVTFCLKLIVDPWPVIFVTLIHGTPRVEGVTPTRLCHFFCQYLRSPLST